MKIAIMVLSLVLACFINFLFWYYKEDVEFNGIGWDYRSKYFSVEGDGCGLLDKNLGANARSPRKLLEVFTWQYHDDPAENPHGLGYPDFYEGNYRVVFLQNHL